MLIACFGLQTECEMITSSLSRPLRHMLMCGLGVQLPMMSAADMGSESVTVAYVSELSSTGDSGCEASEPAGAVVSSSGSPSYAKSMTGKAGTDG